MTALQQKIYTIRDIGYDGDNRTATWYDCQGQSLTEAVCVLLDRKGLTVERHGHGNLYSVYAAVPHANQSWTKVTTIQFDSVRFDVD